MERGKKKIGVRQMGKQDTSLFLRMQDIALNVYTVFPTTFIPESKI